MKLMPGDLVRICGVLRIVRSASGGLVSTGCGRGYSRYWSLNNVEALIGRNLKLKPGVRYDGMSQSVLEHYRIVRK